MNEFDLPNESDVTEINSGDLRINVVRVTPENREYLIHMALMMYANEPCRICGLTITEEQVIDAVFAGYSDDNSARSAHRDCWAKYGTHPDSWVHQ